VLAKATSTRRLQLGQPLLVPTQVAAIGATLPYFNYNITDYEDIDILSLVIFYNVDFGIVDADSIYERVDKFCTFLKDTDF